MTVHGSFVVGELVKTGFVKRHLLLSGPLVEDWEQNLAPPFDQRLTAWKCLDGSGIYHRSLYWVMVQKSTKNSIKNVKGVIIENNRHPNSIFCRRPASDGPLKNVFSYRAKVVLVHAFLGSKVSENKKKANGFSLGYHNVQKSWLIEWKRAQIVISMKLPFFFRFRLRYSINFPVSGGDIELACFRFSEKLCRLVDSRSKPVVLSESSFSRG